MNYNNSDNQNEEPRDTCDNSQIDIFKHSCDVLSMYSPFTSQELTKKYRIMALKYHPDKHKQSESVKYSAKFQEINDAYLYLKYHTSDSMHNMESSNGSNKNTNMNTNVMNFNELFTSLVSSMFKNNTSSIVGILKSIVQDYQNIPVHLFDKLDNEQIVEIFEFINSYYYIFHIPRAIIDDIKVILTEKIKSNTVANSERIIILNPSVSDLFNDNIYILNYDNQKYYIPLWHSELHYNHTDNNKLIVKCIPELPDNIVLDGDNNIYITIHVPIIEIFKKTMLSYKIADKDIVIPANMLTIQPVQKYVVKKRGISVIHTYDIYYNKSKSDIIFNVHLHE